MYAGRVACCPPPVTLIMHARSIKIRKKTGQTDGRTPDRYVTLTTIEANGVIKKTRSPVVCSG